ncbi:MAG TPA: HIT family protein, partial [Actinomycetota bacterium]
FCKVIAGELPSTQLMSDDRVVVFMDIYPVSHGHCLVVTKEHRPTVYEITDEDGAAAMSAARRVALAIRDGLKPDGLNLHQSNGAVAGQVVPHFHIHLIPRWEGDDTGIRWRSHPGDPSRIAEAAEQIKGALGPAGGFTGH